MHFLRHIWIYDHNVVFPIFPSLHISYFCRETTKRDLSQGAERQHTGGEMTPIVNPTSPMPPITTTPNPTTTSGAWCIANPSASQTALQVALDYACGYGGTDCSAFQPNRECWDPNTLVDHASYAFNDYCHKNPVPTSCVFGGAAQITNTDPSKINLHSAPSGSY